MPLQQILPTWLAWNNANFATASGIQDLRTGQDFPVGGLNVGDYFDATEREANSSSALNIGLLHSGRYRLVHVDPGATAANVQVGTIGYVAQGKVVQAYIVYRPGTGGTPGTYNITPNPGSGGGSGAVVQLVVGASGGVVSATVLQGGFNYVSPPNFSTAISAIPGLSGFVSQSQLNTSPNVVTSTDVALNPPGTGGVNQGVRPVIFLNPVTPGNYGFVQELGVATVLFDVGTGNSLPGAWVIASTNNNGAAKTGAITAGNVIGQLNDFIVVGPTPIQTLAKVYLNLVPICQD
jgi:hypothetical protein